MKKNREIVRFEMAEKEKEEEGNLIKAEDGEKEERRELKIGKWFKV